jgi:phosphoserine phosphatase RsbU/P
MTAAPAIPKMELFRGLIRVSCIINSIHDYRQLLTSILTITKEVMDCDAGSLMLFDEKSNDLTWHVALGDKADKLKEMGRLKMGQGIAGWVAQNRKSTLVEDASRDTRFFKGADNKTGFQTRSVVCVPLVQGDKLLGVLQALNPLHKPSFDQNDLEVFEAYGALSATAIEKIRWHETSLQQQKLQQELEIAQEIQCRFLAQEFDSAAKRFKFAFHYQPAFQIGGDFYDIQENDQGDFAMILGDVTGKGVPAALLMAQVISGFRFHAPRERTPSSLLSKLNNHLHAHSTRGMFATAWCAILHPLPDGAVRVEQSSAGHLLPIVRRKSGSIESMDLDSGFPLGLMPEQEFQSKDVTLARDDLMLIYTDGISEAKNRDREDFGLPRLTKSLTDAPAGDPCAVRDRLIQEVGAFTGEAQQHDDLTLMIFGPR